MAERGNSGSTGDRNETRERARERLAARQRREAAESGKRAPREGRTSHATPTAETLPARLIGGIVGAFRSVVDRIGLKGIALAAGAVVVLIILIVGISVGMQSCSSDQAAQDPAPEEQMNTDVPTEPIEVNVPDSIDAELAASLVAAAATDGDVGWIANHAEDYAMDGEAVQTKLLKLAATEPESVGFVRAFIDSYPSEVGQAYTDEVTQGTVPRFYQWDQQWGYTVFSSTTFALTGCCPTALSMIYMGLTGNNDISPYDMGVRAQEGGYMSEYNGTDASFLVNEAPALGMACSTIGVDGDSLRSALENGQPVICNVGPGDFTEGGHYFVITGLNEDGTVTINDPYSAERSAKTWDIDLILGQTKALFAYSLA